MNTIGVLFGLFIIDMGFLTLEPTLDKDPGEKVPVRGIMVDAGVIKKFGIMVMVLGIFILIFSLIF